MCLESSVAVYVVCGNEVRLTSHFSYIYQGSLFCLARQRGIKQTKYVLNRPLAKNCASLNPGGITSGWFMIFANSSVVPPFFTPITKKYGRHFNLNPSYQHGFLKRLSNVKGTCKIDTWNMLLQSWKLYRTWITSLTKMGSFGEVVKWFLS